MRKSINNPSAMNTADQIVLFNSILESTTKYAILAVDLKYKILIWNEGAKQLYGYTNHEVINKSAHILYHKDDIKSDKINKIFDVVRQKGIWSGELLGVAKNGSQFKTLLNISLCKNLKGKTIGYTLIARDITELQTVLQVMSKLKESERLLHLKNEELKKKIQEAKIANRSKNEFLANMSHELRTPLNGIIGFSQMLIKRKVGTLTEKQDQYLTNVLNCAQHLLLLINDLLDLEKISSGKMEFFPEKIHLSNFVNESCESFKSQLLKKNLQLNIQIDETIDEIVIDPIKLKQILNNYVSNAITFTEDHGKINVCFKKDKKYHFRLEVQDTGIGIHKKDLKLLFKEFQQLSIGVGKKHPGTGLGLALTRKIVESQGGQIGVESIPGKGSTFYAVLPLFSLPNNSYPTQKTNSIKTEKPKILVIEEESQQRKILLQALKNAGFRTGFANNIQEILRSSSLLNADAIILDFFLSDINNWRVLKALHLEKQHFPILILVIALEAGNFGFRIQDFLIKPIVPENLISALKLAGASPHQNKTILIVDDDKKIATMAKQALPKFGYHIICASDKESALAKTDQQSIHIIIVNILMQGIEGLDFLMQYQRSNQIQNTPIIIWRAENIDEAELNHLKNMAQQSVLKDEDISKSLLSEFEKILPIPIRN